MSKLECRPFAVQKEDKKSVGPSHGVAKRSQHAN